MLGFLISTWGIFSSCVVMREARSETSEPSAIKVLADDEAIQKIADSAQLSFAEFAEHLLKPSNDEMGFCVSLRLPTETALPGSVETLWLTDLTKINGEWSGTLMDTPDFLQSVRRGDRISFLPNQVTDWRYVKGGYLVGGNSLIVLLKRVGAQQQQEVLRALDFRFRDFPMVPVANEGQVPQKWKSSLWSFNVEFPSSWEHPRADADSVQTKSAIQVICDSRYGASVAVFANPAEQFSSSGDNAVSMLKNLLLNRLSSTLTFVDMALEDRGATARKRFYFDHGSQRHAYYVVMNGSVAVTFSAWCPASYGSRRKMI